jgi:hypothetical protein
MNAHRQQHACMPNCACNIESIDSCMRTLSDVSLSLCVSRSMQTFLHVVIVSRVASSSHIRNGSLQARDHCQVAVAAAAAVVLSLECKQ